MTTCCGTVIVHAQKPVFTGLSRLQNKFWNRAANVPFYLMNGSNR